MEKNRPSDKKIILLYINVYKSYIIICKKKCSERIMVILIYTRQLSNADIE